MSYSFTTSIGDGVTTVYPFSFAGQDLGYLAVSNVVVFVAGTPVPFTIPSNDPNKAYLTSAPPFGAEVLIRRVMPKNVPYSDFARGNPFSQDALNNTNLQQLYIVQEILDGYMPTGFYFKSDINMGGYKLVNLGEGTQAGDSVRYEQWLDNKERLDRLELGLVDNVAQRTIPWYYIATGGETELSPPYDFQAALAYRGGLFQNQGLGAFSITNNKIKLAEPLEPEEEFYALLGSSPAAPDDYAKLTEVIRLIEESKNTRELWRRSLAEIGLTLVSGSFRESATVYSATDAVWDIDGAQCYTWTGDFPHTAEGSPGSGWVSVGGLSLRGRLSQTDGFGLVGTITYLGVRAYNGNASTLAVSGRDSSTSAGAGEFRLSETDTTTPDDDGVTLVDALGRRWRRVYDTGHVELSWFGAKGGGDGDTSGFQNAMNNHKIIHIARLAKPYIVSKQIVLDQHTLFSDGVGRTWGNTGAIITISGVAEDFAVISRGAVSKISGIKIQPVSWEAYSGAGLHVQKQVILSNAAITGFKEGNVKGWEDTTKGFEPWSSKFYNCDFDYSGRHGVAALQGANDWTLIDCKARWAGSPGFMQPPTIAGEYMGLFYGQDTTLSRPVFEYSPETGTVLGGDYSYNSNCGVGGTHGLGLYVDIAFCELNLDCSLSLGGKVIGSTFNINRATGAFKSALPVITDSTVPWSPALYQNKITMNGRSYGNGMRHSDTGSQSLPLTNNSQVHEVLSSFGATNITKLVTTGGGMILKGTGTSRPVIRLTDVNLTSEQFQNIPNRLKQYETTASIPAAAAEYEGAMIMDKQAQLVKVCMWDGSYTWRALQWMQ